MKLCPLLESILPVVDPRNGPHSPTSCIKAGIALCNDALPREAIEAAIVALMLCREARDYPTRELYADYIEQLQALLPKEE